MTLAFVVMVGMGIALMCGVVLGLCVAGWVVSGRPPRSQPRMSYQETAQLIHELRMDLAEMESEAIEASRVRVDGR